MKQSNSCLGTCVSETETDTPLETNLLSQQLIRWLKKVGGQNSHPQNETDNLAMQMSRGNTVGITVSRCIKCLRSELKLKPIEVKTCYTTLHPCYVEGRCIQ